MAKDHGDGQTDRGTVILSVTNAKAKKKKKRSVYLCCEQATQTHVQTTTGGKQSNCMLISVRNPKQNTGPETQAERQKKRHKPASVRRILATTNETTIAMAAETASTPHDENRSLWVWRWRVSMSQCLSVH